ncbi:MAG: tetratricopeptide repeat protein [Bacteroidetes bacterium]|nr:tetratricopeptide repeat protein [Bacteroidota bacterium]
MKKSKLIFGFLVITGTVMSSGAQTLKDAMRLTENEQYEAAASLFRMLVSWEPANGTNYYYFGENFLLSDSPDSAFMMFDKGVRSDPNNPLNVIGKAKYKLNKYGIAEMKSLSERAVRDAEKAKREFDMLPNKTKEDEVKLIGEMNAKSVDAQTKYQEAKTNVEEARTMIDEVITKTGSKNAAVLMESSEAFVRFKNKDLDKAKGILDKAFALEPKNPEIQILYGDIYSELHNGSLAAEYYNKALDLDKNSVKAIVSKGKLYGLSTNYEGAAEEYQNAIKIDSTFAPAHQELGEVFFRSGKLEKAKAEYRKYLELSKNSGKARVRYASFLYFSKDYSGALNEINQLSKTDENNLKLLRVSSYCYYETKEYSKGLAVVQKLFSKLDQENIAGVDHEYYGKLLAANNQDSLGIIELRKAFEMDNGRTDLLSEIANSYFKMKKYPEAISTLIEKINTGKDVKVADYFTLGRAYLFNSEFMKADSAFAKVNELAPKYASGFLNRAKANTYIDTDSIPGLAKPHYEKYIELVLADTAGMANKKYSNSSLIESYRYLAACFVKPEWKDFGKAEEYLQKILSIDPEDKEAKEGIDALRKLKKKQ